ncbi:MAG: hypothetical protein L7U87_01655 [Chlamydiales bacterium]|nr:hypothetical protein [Chlamydiales bacterium]
MKDINIAGTNNNWPEENWGISPKSTWSEDGGIPSREGSRMATPNPLTCQPYQTATLEKPVDKLPLFDNEEITVTLSIPEMESQKMDAIMRAIFK